MPLYEYECRSCGAQFEKLILNRRTKVVCKSCGGKQVDRRLSTFAIASSGSRPAATPDAGPCGSCGAFERGMCGGMDRD
jgi:putative FmdB family regulatory protein